jgi:hypothetical protein
MSRKYQPEHETILNTMMQDLPQAKAGKMFGYPAYKVNGKLAASLHAQGVVLKLGQLRVNELVGQGQGAHFEPMPGRVWKDWLLLTADFEQHRPLFAEAVALVAQETR